MSFALIAIYLSAFGQLPFEQYIYVLAIALSSTILSDLVISYVRKRKLFIPHAAVVTGMILILLVDPTLAWYKIVAIAFIAMAIKNFIRINNKHIFNPAASGLLMGGLIFGVNASWWGTSFQYSSNFTIQTLILYVILLLPLYISAYRMRRYYSILSFLISYIVLITISLGNFALNTLSFTLFNPTIIFFSLVMLPEPLTSPSDKHKQILYGVTVSVLTFLLGSRFLVDLGIVQGLASIDVFIMSLLIANLIFFKK